MNSTIQTPISLMIADDHKLFADGLCAILSACPNFEVIGSCTNGKEALHLLNSKLPDVLIIDLNMPVMDGEMASEKILKLYPEIKILVLSMYYTDKLSTRLQEMGIMGYVPKDTDAQALFQIIEEINDGKKHFNRYNPPQATESEFNDTDSFLKKHNLTSRELDVLKLISKGYSSKQIAQELYISLNTVDTHRKNMIQKLSVTGRSGLIKFAFDNNLV